MSQWAAVCGLSDHLKQILFKKYEEKCINIEVRHSLAQFIESNFIPYDVHRWPVNEEREEFMWTTCAQLVQQLGKTVQILEKKGDFSHLRLSKSLKLFQTMPPSELFQRIKDCLDEEIRILAQQEAKAAVQKQNFVLPATEIVLESSGQRSNFGQLVTFLEDQVSHLSANFKSSGSIANAIFAFIQRLEILTDERSNLIYRFRDEELSAEQNFELGRIETDTQNYVAKLRFYEEEFVSRSTLLVTQLTRIVFDLQSQIISKLKWSETLQWENQEISFDRLQKVSTDLLESAQTIFEILKQMEIRGNAKTAFRIQQNSQQIIRNLMQKLNAEICTLLQNLILVEAQPPQVIKKEVKFNMSVAFLCSQSLIQKNGNSLPKMKVSILNQRQAQFLFENVDNSAILKCDGWGQLRDFSTAQSPKNVGGTESPESQPFSVQLKDVVIKTIRRGESSDKKTSTKAMTEKFCLLISSSLKINGNVFHFWCCSIPFVFIVHACQKSDGWATVFWDRSFREVNRIPFEVPQEICWSRLAPALVHFFKSMTRTPWSLSEANLKYIGSKIRQSFSENSSEFCPREFTVSRKYLCEKPNTVQIGLWDWFFAIIELINKHLHAFWDGGFVVGFIDRMRAESILSSMDPGTFILRFSDSFIGGVSVTYVDICHSTGVKMVRSLKPFTDTDLKFRGLAQRLADAHQLKYVYHFNSSDSDRSSDRGFVPRLSPKDFAFPLQTQKVEQRGQTKEPLDGVGDSGKSPYVSTSFVMRINAQMMVDEKPEPDFDLRDSSSAESLKSSSPASTSTERNSTPMDLNINGAGESSEDVVVIGQLSRNDDLRFTNALTRIKYRKALYKNYPY